MKTLIFYSSLVLVFLTGCQIQENYTIQYGFTAQEGDKVVIEPISGGVNLEIPFSNFTCDAVSVQANIKRVGEDFILDLSGNETEDRCSQLFTAKVDGIHIGGYMLEVNYVKDGEPSRILKQQFSVTE